MTEIKKLIEEKAIKFAKDRSYTSFYTDDNIPNALANLTYSSFKAGASFILHQNRWRKVEEEMPTNQDIVLVKTDKGCFATAYLHGKESGFIIYGDEAYKEFGEITEWRPIL